jgi:tRNA pseudouridine55 synthase
MPALMNGKNGLILLDTPEQITSFQALNAIKKKLDTKKVGHAGTLDKFASGLLIVLAGPCTRITPVFQDLDKEYVAGIRFGIETDTLDPEGAVVKRTDQPDLKSIQGVLAGFTGEILQAPPEYSAVHVNGERAYRMMRNGDAPVMKPRPVTIHALSVVSYQDGLLNLGVRCSKGTYIRSLARDIGAATSTCAHVETLRRVRIGPFSVDAAVSPGDFSAARHLLDPYSCLSRIESLRKIFVKNDYRAILVSGKTLRDDYFETGTTEEGEYAVFDQDKNLYAFIEKKDGILLYKAVLKGQ